MRPLPSSTSSNVTRVAGHQPWWDHLHHRIWQWLQIRQLLLAVHLPTVDSVCSCLCVCLCVGVFVGLCLCVAHACQCV